MKKSRLFLLILTLALLLFSCSPLEPEKDVLQIYVLDVGQGDAILLRCPEGDILIDAGPEQSQELLCLRLEQLGVEELSLAIFTHPDEDHIGGGDGVLSEHPVREVWINGSDSEELCYVALMQEIEKSDAELKTVRAGDGYTLGALSLFVFSPMAGEAQSGNADSIALKLTYGDVRAVLTGDADADSEEAMLARYGEAQLDCEIYKVGHHGSNTSSTAGFLEAMSPEYALISAGKGNSYGHPHGQVLERLEDMGAEILRVDQLGELLLETDGKTIVNKSK